MPRVLPTSGNSRGSLPSHFHTEMTHGGGEREGLSEDAVEEDQAHERARNELAFTMERFRRLGVQIPTEEERERERERARQYALSEEARILARRNEVDLNMMTGRLVFYDEIQDERPSESERIQYLMDITRSSPPPERQEEEEESEEEEEEESEEEEEEESEEEEEEESEESAALTRDVEARTAAARRRREIEEVRRHARRETLQRIVGEHRANRRVRLVDQRDVELVSSQTGVSEPEAAATLAHFRGDLINTVMYLSGGPREPAIEASAEEAITRAEEALASSSAQDAAVFIGDDLPHVHDWARLSATATEDGDAGHATRTQDERDERLDALLTNVAQIHGSLHDAGESGMLRDLVYPTLEWRMAWARERARHSTRRWRLHNGMWYRVIAMLCARYPDSCRQEEPYRGQARLSTEVYGDIQWLEYLLMEPTVWDPAGDAGWTEQQQRTEEVKRLLATLNVVPQFADAYSVRPQSPSNARNRIRVLMRDTMANLNPGARQWADPIWAHVLSCVRKWDDEMMTMRTSQQRAVQMRSGEREALIEAQATLFSQNDRVVQYNPERTAAAISALNERRALEDRGEVAYEWPNLQQELDEVSAAEAMATEAEFARVAAEQTAVALAVTDRRATRNTEERERQRIMASIGEAAHTIFVDPSNQADVQRAEARRASQRGWRERNLDRRMQAVQTLVRERGEEFEGLEVLQREAMGMAMQYEFSDTPRSERLAKVTKERLALEEQMEQGQITEGVYLERMNALRDEYNGVTQLPPDQDVNRGFSLTDRSMTTGTNGIHRGMIADHTRAHIVHSAEDDGSMSDLLFQIQHRRASVPFNVEPPNNEIPEEVD